MAWLRTAAALGLLVTVGAKAQPEAPDYIQTGWRARLAGMADTCKFRTPEWAGRLAAAQKILADRDAPQQSVLGSSIPTDDAQPEIRGAIAAYVRIGKMIGAQGKEACGAFATADTMTTADAEVAAAEAAKLSTAVPALPPYLSEPTINVFTAQLAAECHARSSAWGFAAFAANHADAIDRTYTDRDKPGADPDLHDSLMEEEGALEAALFAAERAAAVDSDHACGSITKWPTFTRADAVRLDYARHPEKFLKHIKTPED